MSETTIQAGSPSRGAVAPSSAGIESGPANQPVISDCSWPVCCCGDFSCEATPTSPPATKGVTEALRRIASLRYAEDADVYDTLEEALSIADTALASLSPLPAPGEATEVSIKPMHLSDDRCDYFVSFKHGSREVTPHVFRERFKAEYHVALYRWLFGHGDKPAIMDFDEGDWPAREYTAEEQRAFAALSTPAAGVLAVKDGWVLVPRNPTPEMLGAWYRYKSGHHWPDEPPPRDTSDYGAYAAMLLASPKQGEKP
ncbi:hypothetical protein [Mesorhizobium sp. B2-1-2]|uniref:hypothetical protein n=1 Tax=Mesorhizobium sp. B2-1-2 TaxID=2589973 RepID=UPI0011280EA1|nr:hypothetical protein [Mesorhizobium sp. B2-1-2]TPN11669.1 hypothetical protein FJ971_09685 [Mesorhizobium sp. B2-1-2]